MALATNDDFASRELSIEELEAIAAGGWFSGLVHGVEHAANASWHWLEGPAGNTLLQLTGIGLGLFVGTVVGGGGNGGTPMKQN